MSGSLERLTREAQLSTGVYCLFTALDNYSKVILLPVLAEDFGARYGGGKLEAEIGLHTELQPITPDMHTVLGGADKNNRGVETLVAEIRQESRLPLDSSQLRPLPEEIGKTNTLQQRGTTGLYLFQSKGWYAQLPERQIDALADYCKLTRPLNPELVFFDILGGLEQYPGLKLRPFAQGALRLYKMLCESAAMEGS